MREEVVQKNTLVRVTRLQNIQHHEFSYLIDLNKVREPISARREGQLGIAQEYIPGTAFSFWFVRHQDSPTIGLYSVEELERI